MKKIFTLLCAFCCTLPISAHDFRVDGISYNITSSSESYEVEVTSSGSSMDRYGGTVTIPSSVRCNGITYAVTSIGSSAFADSWFLTSITIPESVTEIGRSAFDGCTGLTSITIPESVTSIGESAFYHCVNLKTVYNYSSLELEKGSSSHGYVACYASAVYNIGFILYDYAFSQDSTQLLYYMGQDTELTLPSKFSYAIMEYAFWNMDFIQSITLPESVTSIGDYAFYDCTGLTSITLPESVTSIGSNAFNGSTALRSLRIGQNTNAIGSDAFAGCTALDTIVWNAKDCPKYEFPAEQIKSFTFGTEVEVIPDGLCQGMSNNNALTELILPKIRTIGANSFNGGAPRLAKLELGKEISEIGKNAFAQCGKLTHVTCHAKDVPVVWENSFYNYLGYLYVPCDVLEDYKMDMTFSKFAHIECINSEAEDIENTTIQGLRIMDGTILCNEAFHIYTPTGLDLTAQNGALPAGVYIVRTATATQKVLLP